MDLTIGSKKIAFNYNFVSWLRWINMKDGPVILIKFLMLGGLWLEEQNTELSNDVSVKNVIFSAIFEDLLGGHSESPTKPAWTSWALGRARDKSVEWIGGLETISTLLFGLLENHWIALMWWSWSSSLWSGTTLAWLCRQIQVIWCEKNNKRTKLIKFFHDLTLISALKNEPKIKIRLEWRICEAGVIMTLDLPS